MITQELVRELFDYDASTGDLIRKKDTYKYSKGSISGCVDSSNGYRKSCIGNKVYFNHRIVFVWHHGYLPKYIDHIDRNPLNNRIENLRACTQSQNLCNATQRSDNKSGFRGVWWDKVRGNYQVTIRITGKRKHLGRFLDPIDAATAYNFFAQALHGEFAHFNGLQDNLAYGFFI